MKHYHHAFIVLPFRVKVNHSEVYGPDEGDVQHGVERSGATQSNLITNLNLSVFRSYRDAGGL